VTAVTLGASYNGVTDTAIVTVVPAPVAALIGLAISPTSITFGQSATGTVLLNGAAPSGGLVVSISSSHATAASFPSTVNVPAGASSASFVILAKEVSASTSVTLTALLAGASKTAKLTVNPLPATASWLGFDTVTQGSWKSKYGESGHAIAKDSAAGPIQAVLTASTETWESSTGDVRALQTAAGNTRIAAAWDSSGSFNIDVNPPDTLVHQIAVYCLDWNSVGRTETIAVLDADSNQVLDSRSVSNFSAGTYVVWSFSGHLKLRVTKTSSRNAVVSGVFID
jgi:hypothetical protein